jgi:hypothetical protein
MTGHSYWCDDCARCFRDYNRNKPQDDACNVHFSTRAHDRPQGWKTEHGKRGVTQCKACNGFMGTIHELYDVTKDLKYPDFSKRIDSLEKNVQEHKKDVEQPRHSPLFTKKVDSDCSTKHIDLIEKEIAALRESQIAKLDIQLTGQPPQVSRIHNGHTVTAGDNHLENCIAAVIKGVNPQIVKTVLGVTLDGNPNYRTLARTTLAKLQKTVFEGQYFHVNAAAVKDYHALHPYEGRFVPVLMVDWLCGPSHVFWIAMSSMFAVHLTVKEGETDDKVFIYAPQKGNFNDPVTLTRGDGTRWTRTGDGYPHLNSVGFYNNLAEANKSELVNPSFTISLDGNAVNVVKVVA